MDLKILIAIVSACGTLIIIAFKYLSIRAGNVDVSFCTDRHAEIEKSLKQMIENGIQKRVQIGEQKADMVTVQSILMEFKKSNESVAAEMQRQALDIATMTEKIENLISRIDEIKTSLDRDS